MKKALYLLNALLLLACAGARSPATLPSPSQRVQLHFSNWLALYEPYAYHIVVEDPLPPLQPTVSFQYLEPPFFQLPGSPSFQISEVSPGVYLLRGYFSPRAPGRWRMRVRVKGQTWVDAVTLVHYFRVY